MILGGRFTRKIQHSDIDEVRESYEEDSPELEEQIREGYEAYLRGEGTDAEVFLAELERERVVLYSFDDRKEAY